MNFAFIENLIVWVVDFFKVRNPKLFAVISVALVAALGFLNDAVNKGVVCSGWEENVTADHYAHVAPGDSFNLNIFVPDSLAGSWVNEDDGHILAETGGIATYVFQGEAQVITVATNTCFINDTSGIVQKILFWLTVIVMALTGVHTTERKKEILAKRALK